MYTISKRYRFEAAHRLFAPYVGKCNSLHGHSFQVTLSMSTGQLNTCDMVYDFSELHPIKDWIKTHLDHATLVGSRDTELHDWLKRTGQKHFVIDGNPTAELIAKLIADQATRLGFDLNLVTVAETCTASAAFRP